MSFGTKRSLFALPFDKPGKATGWGIAGCVLCTLLAQLGFMWTVVITVVTALAGCWDG